MIRKGMVRAIKPEYIKEYKKTHSDVWPEILQRITNCKIKNYSVFAQEDRLFSFFEYHGDNFEDDTKKMRDNPKFKEWEKFHEHMFRPLGDKEKDEGWVELEEVFRKE
tara:strand:+ start:31 stop:354 length:324 start_codon:yes stop_codon:yes gene_type:complete